MQLFISNFDGSQFINLRQLLQNPKLFDRYFGYFQAVLFNNTFDLKHAQDFSMNLDRNSVGARLTGFYDYHIDVAKYHNLHFNTISSVCNAYLLKYIIFNE
jgi:hypothetical protein